MTLNRSVVHVHMCSTAHILQPYTVATSYSVLISIVDFSMKLHMEDSRELFPSGKHDSPRESDRLQ